jgi:hypothetical protein
VDTVALENPAGDALVRFEVGPHTLRVGESFESRVTVALVNCPLFFLLLLPIPHPHP